MKRLFLILCFLFISANAWGGVAEFASTSTGEYTTSFLAYNGACYLTAVQVLTDGSNPATVLVLDSTTSSGTVVAQFVVAGASNSERFSWNYPIHLTKGAYISISGTGASAIAEYAKQ